MDELLEFHQDMLQQVYAAADTDADYHESQFLQKATEYLIDEGVIEDFLYLPYRHPRGMRADGYDYTEDRGVLHLFVCDFRNSNELTSLTNTEILNNFKRVEKFFQNALKYDFRTKLEETSPGFALADFIYTHREQTETVKIHLISNGALSSRVKSLTAKELEGYAVQYDIWDLSRFYQIESSGKGKEDIEIDFLEEFGKALPSLPAHTSSTDYKSYLVVMPGITLAALYDKYGARLLEQNVRSFLQLRGNVNKGIRRTILEEPEMFFAYNNGITATAEKVSLSEDGQNIYGLKNFQIVNGGQTTASLFNVQRNDSKTADLSKIFVQMKLSIIEPEKIGDVVPKISQYANTQNKVSDADFFSNHEFHIRLEEKSRRIWAPAKEGEIRKTKWFYERARGQYMDAQSKLTPAKKKEFKETHPNRQMFSKTDVAKFLMVWEPAPHTVSLGSQKNFKAFAELIDKRWKSNNEQYNDLFFKHTVAKAIMFKETETLVSSQPWYQTGGNRGDIVIYSLSLLAYLTTQEGLYFDFDRIWTRQSMDKLTVNELVKITAAVNSYIHESSPFNNTHEWCKKELCWKKLQELVQSSDQVSLSDDFVASLKSKDEIKSEEKEAKKEQKIDNAMDLVSTVIKMGSAKWQEILEWGLANKLLDDSETGIINVAIRVETTGRIPTEKQCKRLMMIVDKLEDEGMLIQIDQQ